MSTETRRHKRALYEQLARIGKAFGSAPRVELLDVLGQGPRTVESLAHEVDRPVANVSHHLQAMRRVGLVDAERRGTYMHYRLADDEVGRLLVDLRTFAHDRLLEMRAVTEAFLEAHGAMEAVDDDTLVDRIRAGEVTLLDVRPAAEFAAGHLPGALSLPVADLDRRLGELPRDRTVVAYCRGPYCVMAIDAVARLRAAGYDAVRFDDGVQEWRARGFHVAAG